MGATALLEGNLVGPIGWFARATFTLSLLNQTFTVDLPADANAPSTVRAAPVFEPVPGGILVGGGLRWRWSIF